VGYLSLSEMGSGIQETPGLKKLGACAPAMCAAYNAAAQLNTCGNYVSKIEFRVLLVYLKLYFGLFCALESEDTGCDTPFSLPTLLPAPSSPLFHREGNALTPDAAEPQPPTETMALTAVGGVGFRQDRAISEEEFSAMAPRSAPAILSSPPQPQPSPPPRPSLNASARSAARGDGVCSLQRTWRGRGACWGPDWFSCLQAARAGMPHRRERR
jgi:hypothetical protein